MSGPLKINDANFPQGTPNVNTLMFGAPQGSGTGFNFTVAQLLALFEESGIPVTSYADTASMLAGDELLPSHFALAGSDLYIYFGSDQSDIANYLIVSPYKPVVVRAVATTNITIATALNDGDSLDGVTLADGDYVLTAGQTVEEDRVIWVVDAVPYPLTGVRYFQAMLVYVQEGTAGAQKTYQLVSPEGESLYSVSEFVWLDLLAGAAIVSPHDTFTPGIAFGGGTTGIMYSVQNGRTSETILDNGDILVHFRIRVGISNKGSSTGALTITGLTRTANADYACVLLTSDSSKLVFSQYPQVHVSNGLTSIQVFNGSLLSAITDSDITIPSGALVLHVSGFYYHTP